MINTIVQSDDTWMLWGILAVWASISIFLEQKYKWASVLSGAVIALLGALILSNLNIIPTESPVYDAVWTYLVPLAIPLLLFNINMRELFQESKKLILTFLICAIGTVIGSSIGFFLLKDHIPELAKLSAAIAASYVGGGVNFAAVVARFEPSSEMVSATVVADNMVMAAMFALFMLIPSLVFFKKRFNTPHIDELERGRVNKEETLASKYWRRKEISLKDVAASVGTSFFLVVLSFKLAEFFDRVIPSDENTSGIVVFLNGMLGEKYLLLSTLTFLFIYFFPNYFNKIRGGQELGTYLIYIFFVVIGAPASISLIIEKAPLLILFVSIVGLFNLGTGLLFGKLFKLDLEHIVLASNATVGGPTTASAMAIAKGWRNLVGPILVVGTLGYIIGNYIGFLLGHWFLTF
ncbi:DUF819 domain-containing protein [Priestia endophytica]|uniref:DUF819 family protein n=1 Tax=Priestia endophytica TaxID=135735 RepID=UPI00227EC751|nr:DUF819 family protein [Priestia endophytica]MCY8230933.1 DUF819 family protein [Priestia endophytica]